MRKSPQSSIAEAYQWVSVLITVTLEMVLPAYGGSLLDKRWQTGSVFSIAGACLGVFVAIRHLMSVSSSKSKTGSHRHNNTKSNTKIDPPENQTDTKT